MTLYIHRKGAWGGGMSTLSGGNSEHFLELCKLLNIPWVDKRGINFDLKNKIICGPMIDQSNDDSILKYLEFCENLNIKTNRKG